VNPLCVQVQGTIKPIMGTRSCKATAVRILFGLLVVLGEWCTPSLAPGQTLSRVSSASGSEARQTGEQLRAAAEQAERMRNWETAFTLYCQLYLIDRTAPDLRARLHQTWRRLHQYRRLRDPHYLRYVRELAAAEALQLLAEVMTKVPTIYVNRERSRPQQLWEYGLEELSHALDDDAFVAWILPQATTALLQQFKTELQHWRQMPIGNARQARQTLRRLLTHWQEQTPLTDPTAIVLEVVHGACNGLDESSAFIPPLPPPPQDLQPQGVCLRLHNGLLSIDGIIRGSWAEQHTPLQAGQIIVQINGCDLCQTEVTWEVIRETLRHPHQGWHELTVVTGDTAIPELVVRLPADPPSVYGKTLKVSRGTWVGYLRLGMFRESTPRELDSALVSLQQDGVQALILDLRGNIGGSFTAALELARRFLPKGTIVTTEGQAPEVNNVTFMSDSGTAASSLPLVVLIDGETASAAEMLAAALKDQQRATLIGTPTFGKGTLQYPLALEWLDTAAKISASQMPPQSPRGGIVRLTIARLISPAGYPLHITGVQPHQLETDPHNQLTLAIQKAAELAQMVDTAPSSLSPSDNSDSSTIPPSTLPMYHLPEFESSDLPSISSPQS